MYLNIRGGTICVNCEVYPFHPVSWCHHVGWFHLWLPLPSLHPCVCWPGYIFGLLAEPVLWWALWPKLEKQRNTLWLVFTHLFNLSQLSLNLERRTKPFQTITTDTTIRGRNKFDDYCFAFLWGWGITFFWHLLQANCGRKRTLTLYAVLLQVNAFK